MKNQLFSIYTFAILILFFAFSSSVQAQPQSKSGNNFYEVQELDSVPVFAGGKAAMDKFVNTSIKKFNTEGCLGAVLVSFIVETDGSVSNIELIRKVCLPADEAVIEMVKKMPKWRPGYLTGVPVRTRIFLPIRFALNDQQPQIK